MKNENISAKEKTVNLKILYTALFLIVITAALIVSYISGNAQNLVLEDTTSGNTVYTPQTTQRTVTARELEATDGPDTTEPPTNAITSAPTEAAPTEPPTLFEAAVPYESYYSLPLSGTTVKNYSNSAPVYSQTLGDWRAHNAVDFAGVVGDRVGSISAGEVKRVYYDELFGWTVVVDHGSAVEASYCGLSGEGMASEGDVVGINETVGFLGVVPSESSDDAHLHFSVTVDGESVDPLMLMGKYNGNE